MLYLIYVLCYISLYIYVSNLKIIPSELLCLEILTSIKVELASYC